MYNACERPGGQLYLHARYVQNLMARKGYLKRKKSFQLLFLLCSLSLHSAWTLFASQQPIFVQLAEPAKFTLPDNKGSILHQDPISLPMNFHASCETLWKKLPRSFSAPVVEASLVVSFCSGSLSWLHLACSSVNFRTVTIYSKCGMENVATAFVKTQECSETARVVTLPNVGRVDHTIAFHMLNLPLHSTPEEIILFVKDTFLEVHQRALRPAFFADMLAEAAGLMGFGCGLKSNLFPAAPNFAARMKDKTLCYIIGVKKMLSRRLKVKPWQALWNCGKAVDRNISMWHLTEDLERFAFKEYRRNSAKYAKYSIVDDDVSFNPGISFSQWLADINISLPRVTPVCYGGNFAVKVAHILKVKNATKNLVQSLSRGNNIVEGHYCERSWAGLLSAILPENTQSELLGISQATFTHSDMVGALYGCDDQYVSR